MLRLLATYLSKSFTRLLLRTASFENPWQRFVLPVPLGRYGLGAQRDFGWYFEGRSAVVVASIEDVQEWLLGCAYASDPDLFHEADFWQHPCTFEQLRQGDCEDFALWAWRKLVRLGYDAEFVAGRCLQPGCAETDHPHTWVVFQQNDIAYLFDPTIRARAHMIQSLDAVRHVYLPEVSVDQHFTRYAYAGYYLKRRGEKVWPRQSAAVAVAQAG